MRPYSQSYNIYQQQQQQQQQQAQQQAQTTTTTTITISTGTPVTSFNTHILVLLHYLDQVAVDHLLIHTSHK